MSLANESKPDQNGHCVDLLRSAKRLLLPHGHCDFVYLITVLRGSPDKPDGETILNVLRFALHINSGRIIYNFGFVALCGALQTHFHRRGRNGKWQLQRRFLRKRSTAGSTLALSASLRSTVLPKGEPLAIHAYYIFCQGLSSPKKGIAKPPQVFRYPELIRLFCAQRKHHCAGTSFLRSRSIMPAGQIIPFLPGLPPGLPQRRQRPLPPWRQAARRWVLPPPRKHRSARSVPRRRGRCVPAPSPCRSRPDA